MPDILLSFYLFQFSLSKKDCKGSKLTKLTKLFFALSLAKKREPTSKMKVPLFVYLLT